MQMTRRTLLSRASVAAAGAVAAPAATTPCALWPSSHSAATPSATNDNASTSQRRAPAANRFSDIAPAISATAWFLGDPVLYRRPSLGGAPFNNLSRGGGSAIAPAFM